MKGNKKRDIVFLCQYFYPEHNSSATLPFDAASALADAGFSVDVLCGSPKEYSDTENVPSRETVNGIEIKRINYFQTKRSKKLGRLVNYFSFSAGALLKLSVLRNYKAVIVYSNPPVLPLVAVIANILFGTKIVFVSFDVYPEVAVASQNIKAGSMIEKGMSFINRMMFKRVTKAVALTDEMKKFLTDSRKELTEDRIVTIPNWAHEAPPQISSKKAKMELGYKEQDFVVSYLGNMGICQEMETMLKAIKALKSDEDIHFIFAGHGVKTERIREETSDNKNVRMYGFLQGEDFEKVLAASSCCVLSLEKYMKGLGAPSKLYSYMQAGKPLIAVSDKDSYLKTETEDRKIGIHVDINDVSAFTEAVRYLYNNPEMADAMAENAKNIYETVCSKTICGEKYIKLFDEILS